MDIVHDLNKRLNKRLLKTKEQTPNNNQARITYFGLMSFGPLEC